MEESIRGIVLENKASQDPEELKELLRFLIGREQVDPKVILEIGNHRGYNLVNFAKVFPGADVFGINDIEEDLDLEAIRQFDQIRVYIGKSGAVDTLKQVTRVLGRDKVDILFIDGDHHKEAVKRDYELYSQMVAPGGFIIFHDYFITGNDSVEVKEAIDEMGLEIYESIFKGFSGYAIIKL